MRILVTGGAGFIGSYICEALLKRKHHARVLDNLDPQVHGEGKRWPSYLPSDVERILGDIRDRDVVSTALDGCDAVIHLAAAVGVGQSMYEIEHYSSVNVIGTAVLLEELVKRRSQIKKLIVAGSMSSYGEGAYVNARNEAVHPLPRSIAQMHSRIWEQIDDNGEVLKPVPTNERKILQPQSVYAINKRDQEEMCLAVGSVHEIPTVVLRMFNVFGPRQALSNPYTGVVAIFCSRLLNGQPPIIYEDGAQSRDFVYVEDVARAWALALESDGGDYLSLNVGSGKSITIREVAQVLSSVLGKEIEPEVTGKFRKGDIRHCFADISLIKEKLGWEPQWSFEHGIAELVAWLQSQQPTDRVMQAQQELVNQGLLE